MFKTFAIAAVVGLGALPATAQSFKAMNQLAVNPVSSGGFEVVEGRGEGPAGMWCAAGSYAFRRLGANANAQIYVKEPRGDSVTMPGRKGVTFTLDPTGLEPNRTLFFYQTIREPGHSQSVAQARSHCNTYRLRRSN